MRCFDKILESNSERIGVYFEVSDYYRERPNTEKMAEAIEKAERIDPDDRRLKFYKGVLLVMEGKNPSEAEMLLKILHGLGSRQFRRSAACEPRGNGWGDSMNRREGLPKRRNSMGFPSLSIRTTNGGRIIEESAKEVKQVRRERELRENRCARQRLTGKVVIVSENPHDATQRDLDGRAGGPLGQ